MISMILARSQNNVIGINNTLPWHLPRDFQWFKEHSLHKAVIMGRKTFESIGKPLPNRLNIVLTKDTSFKANGIVTTSNLNDAITLAKNHQKNTAYNEVMIIGGQKVFEESLPMVDKIYLTTVLETFEGDTFFNHNLKEFEVIYSEKCNKDDNNAHDLLFEIYQRKNY